MPLKNTFVFRYKNTRPIDSPELYLSNFSSPPPAKYYRKDACPCDPSVPKVAITSVFGDVRTCPKVIGGSSNCIPLSANTNINANVGVDSSGVLLKKYYTSNNEYLKARCRTFDQRSFHFTNADGDLIANCCDSSRYVSGNCSKVVYKPNNTQFSTQGAVSSSDRLFRLRYNTITASKGNNRANCPSCQTYPSSQTQNDYTKATKLCRNRFVNGHKVVCKE